MKILPAVAALSFAVAAHAAPDATFDQGANASAILSEARANVAQPQPDAYQAQYAGSSRYDVDCVVVSFDAKDEPVSQYIHLRSTQWIEECRWIPGGDPRRGGGGYRDCYTRPGGSWSETVRVRLQDRKTPLPWERDNFRVCLEGPWLDARPLATSHKYRAVNSNRGEFVFVAGEKIPMKPDAAGIVIVSLSPTMQLTLRDKWASYYAGEKLKLSIKLMEHVPNWFDPQVAEFAAEVAGAGETINLNLSSSKLKKGKKYYVKVEFSRVGPTSKPDQVSAGENAPVAYDPTPALLSAL